MELLHGRTEAMSSLTRPAAALLVVVAGFAGVVVPRPEPPR